MATPTCRDEATPLELRRQVGQAAPTLRDGEGLETPASRKTRSPKDVLGEERGTPAAAGTIRDASTSSAVRRDSRTASPTLRDGSEPGSAPHALGELPKELSSRYAFVERLAASPGSTVLRAVRLSDDQAVVVKLFDPGIEPDARAREAAARISREHAPALFESGTADGRVYEIAEYVARGDLRGLLGEGRPVPEALLVRMVPELVGAIAALHDAGLVHGDVKPANVFIRSVDPLDLVMGDLDIATVLEAGATAAPRRGLTPAYAAPECHRGEVSAASDWWSIGMLICEALCGRHPFADMDAGQIAGFLEGRRDVCRCDDADPRWNDLLSGLLERDPHERWSAAQVRSWLARREAGEKPSVTGPLGGEAPSTRQELARQLASGWEASCRMIDRDPIDPWLAAQIAALAPDIDVGSLLGDCAIGSERRLLRLLYSLDPELPPVWREWLVSAADVAALCRRALRDDPNARADVADLYRLHVLEEIARGRRDAALFERDRAWRQALDDFDQGWSIVGRYDGPIEARPQHELALAALFLAGTGPFPTGSSKSHEDLRGASLCCPWLDALRGGRDADSPGLRLVREVVAPICAQRVGEGLRTSYAFDAATPVQARRVLQWGRNPPIVAFALSHAAIVFRTCGADQTIGTRARLQWNITGASWRYLARFGRIEPEGERELDLGPGATFTLITAGRGGVAVHRIAGIPVPEVRLEPRSILDTQRARLSRRPVFEWPVAPWRGVAHELRKDAVGAFAWRPGPGDLLRSAGRATLESAPALASADRPILEPLRGEPR